MRKVALPGVDGSIVTGLPMWVHVTYLLVMALAGLYLSIKLLDKRVRQ